MWNRELHDQRARHLTAVLLLLAGCAVDLTAPGHTYPEQWSPAIGSIVSAPGASGVVYASVPRSSQWSRFIGATVMNVNTGNTVTTTVVEGGFDPVTLHGRVGDIIAIRLTAPDGGFREEQTPIPERSTPRVLRTLPIDGATAVNTHTVITVVFSEPMDIATLSAGIALKLDQGVVPGAIESVSGCEFGLCVADIPSARLRTGSRYAIEIAGVTNLAGVALEERFHAMFTTGGPSLEAPRVRHVSTRPTN
jgi:hypothetical protein